MKIYLHLFYPWHEEEQRHVDSVDEGGIIIAEGGPILLPEAALPLVGDVIKFDADKLSDAPSGYYTVEGASASHPAEPRPGRRVDCQRIQGSTVQGSTVNEFERSLDALTLWLAILREEDKLGGFPERLDIDLKHSALLRLITAGQTPWRVPPPKAWSYPWYSIFEHQEDDEWFIIGEIWHASKYGGPEDVVVINQSKWDVVETHGEKDWTLTPRKGNGGGPRAGRWRVTVVPHVDDKNRPSSFVRGRFVRLGEPVRRFTEDQVKELLKR